MAQEARALIEHEVGELWNFKARFLQETFNLEIEAGATSQRLKERRKSSLPTCEIGIFAEPRFEEDETSSRL